MNELNLNQKNEAIRFFNLRRRILDYSNIVDQYDDYEECSIGYLSEEICFTGLSDQDKFAVVVICFQLRDFGVTSKHFKTLFGWDKKKIYSLARNETFIHSATLFSEEDGLIAGKGYVMDCDVYREMDKIYKEFLWHDISQPIHKNAKLLDVNIPGVFIGETYGLKSSDGNFILLFPRCYCYEKTRNWPQKDGSYLDQIKVEPKYVLRWKVI